MNWSDLETLRFWKWVRALHPAKINSNQAAKRRPDVCR